MAAVDSLSNAAGPFALVGLRCLVPWLRGRVAEDGFMLQTS